MILIFFIFFSIAIAARIAAYDYHYQRELLAESLATLWPHWKHLVYLLIITIKLILKIKLINNNNNNNNN